MIAPLSTFRRVACSALVVIAACGRDEAAKRDTDKAATSAGDTAKAVRMSDMPSMSGAHDSANTSAAVTFNAGQVAHGRIQWTAPIVTTIAGIVEVPGQLLANEDRTARLAAPAQGRVLAVHVSPGDRVAGGARLVTLQSQEASMAQADVAKASAELASRRAAATYAKAARDRAERLLALKAIPRQDYERAIADDELARAGLAQAEAELERSRSNAVQLGVDPASGAMTLRAPFAGVITTRDAVPGAVVSAGAQLVTLTDPSSLWLTLALPESFASAIRVGSQVRFVVAALPADTFAARVQSVSAAFDPVSRTLPVRAITPNAGARLRPEMYARAWVESGARSTALTVPDAAIQRLEGKTAVFVARPDGKGGARLETRFVEIGASSGGRTAILIGLAPNELVVVQGAYAVKSEIAKAKMPKMEM